MDGRASREAVEKRRAARLFNEALLGRGSRPGAIDGRTERKRQRLLRELAAAAAGERDMKPVDVLGHVQALLDLGEPLASLRKAYPPRRPVDATDAVVEGARRIHQAYGFSADAYRFVGLDDAVLKRAGVLGRAKADKSRAAADPVARTPARRPGLAPASRDAVARRGVA